MFAMEILDPRAGDGMWLVLGLKLVMILKLMTGSNAARKQMQQSNYCNEKTDAQTSNDFPATALSHATTF
jgi:hypothetical protein